MTLVLLNCIFKHSFSETNTVSSLESQPMIECPSDVCNRHYLLESYGQSFREILIVVSAISSMVSFCPAPDHLYEVEVTVELWVEENVTPGDILQLFLITMISAPKSQAPWIKRNTNSV